MTGVAEDPELVAEHEIFTVVFVPPPFFDDAVVTLLTAQLPPVTDVGPETFTEPDVAAVATFVQLLVLVDVLRVYTTCTDATDEVKPDHVTVLAPAIGEQLSILMDATGPVDTMVPERSALHAPSATTPTSTLTAPIHRLIPRDAMTPPGVDCGRI